MTQINKKEASMEILSKDELKNGYRTAVIIGIAMILSVFSYAVVVELIKMTSDPTERFRLVPEIEIFRFILLGIAVADFFVIRHVRKIMLSGVTNIALLQERKFSPPVSRLLTASVISYTLCELVAVFGLVLFVINWSSLDFYFFTALSLIYFTVYFPKIDDWEEWIKEVERRQEMEGVKA